MKIGLFFGSFNPIHVGHLVLANQIVQYTDVAQIWLVVSPQNPLKDKQTLANSYDRLEMVKLATEATPKLIASDIEFSLPQPSYTIDTLAYLAEKYPMHTFSLIMGMDNLENLHKWKNYEVILEKYEILVYPRPNITIPAQYADHKSIKIIDHCPILEIAATQIRSAIKAKKSVDYILTKPVIDFIENKGLYK